MTTGLGVIIMFDGDMAIHIYDDVFEDCNRIVLGNGGSRIGERKNPSPLQTEGLQNPSILLSLKYRE